MEKKFVQYGRWRKMNAQSEDNNYYKPPSTVVSED
jgi:hypothetical protein